MANDLWRDCAGWLTRCGVLRPDHKANWPEATLTDLAYTLRDGVLLCNFINSIDPGCIDMKDVNQKPQFAQFLCLRNIKTFLQACHEFYALKESDIFEPCMLFDLTDLYRVIHTLSKLSNSPKVQSHNIPGFSVHKPRTLSQEDIYRNLSANSGEEEARAVIEDCVEYAHYDAHIRDEEIYQDLCSIDKHAPPTLLVPSTINHSFEKRDYVINELVETEKNYIDVLSTLQRSFIRPLSIVLKEEDIKNIFGGIKELYDIHVGFHAQLTKGLMPGNPSRLSECFLNFRERFLAYGDYCANLTNSQSKIQELSARNDMFNMQLMRCQEEANNGKFKLRDILSVPMQRILKYHLLLEKLLSETQPNHEDYRGLERAREAMVDVAQYINEVKRDSDTLQIMADIQASIVDMPENAKLRDFGRLIKDGELRIKSHNNQKVKHRYVFIFDKVMLMCKALRGDQYSFKECLYLVDYKVDDVKKTLQQNTRWSYQWYLVRKTECTAFTLNARTEDLKRKWIRALQDAMDNIEPHGCRSTDHKFAMHTFSEPTTCSHCSKFLKGTIYQGYKCERCSIAAHKNCINYSGRCGTKQPPELPPRPPLAPRQDSDLNNIQPLLPRPISGPPDLARTWTDHGPLAEYLWFVGEMGREKATQLLERQLDGTYLLRIRPQGATHPNESVYALSLKADDKVKHMKVYEKMIDGVGQYYLSESRFFRSLVELITCYEHTSLGENFIGLDIRLKWPYRRIVAVAEFDFNPVENNQLPLKQGCQVIVLSKEGDHKGWWKGMIHDRVGFFPKVYVREIADTLNAEFH